jgi:ubiquinone/menaquinone biosynthesis C-methylase UbiE
MKEYIQKQKNTSWQNVSKWYNKVVGEKGSYYHQHVIIPNSLKLLLLKNNDKILDLGCGQGIFSRYIPQNCKYLGIDLSKDLISSAIKLNRNNNFQYKVGDITKQLNVNTKDFTVATIILALQNIQDQNSVIKNVSNYIELNGKLLIVLNHPCFRIPRQSDWGVDIQNKQQYRKIFRYLSPLKIPINMTPGSKFQQAHTWSFHNPISYYSTILNNNGFVIERIEEWVSDKESKGKASKMENRIRSEIPLFMAILARKER